MRPPAGPDVGGEATTGLHPERESSARSGYNELVPLFSSLNAILFSGPLSGPAPNRKVIGKRVMQGRAVDDPSDAGIAVAYGHWVARRYLVGAVLFGAVGVLNVVITFATSSRTPSSEIGVFSLVLAVLYVRWTHNARVSILLNADLAGKAE